MPAAIAERHAAEADPAGPDRPERLEQGAQDFGGGKRLRRSRSQ